MDEKIGRYGCLFCRTGAEAAIAGYINQTITDVEAVVRLSTVFLAKRLTDFVIIRSILHVYLIQCNDSQANETSGFKRFHFLTFADSSL